MLTFGICGLLLICAVSALPAPSGHVLSAVIRNNQNTPVKCTITWDGSNGVLSEKDVITIDSNQEETVNERNIDMGGWNSFAFIKRIQCGSLMLMHPFQGVPSIKKLWHFTVQSNAILSAGPNPE